MKFLLLQYETPPDCLSGFLHRDVKVNRRSRRVGVEEKEIKEEGGRKTKTSTPHAQFSLFLSVGFIFFHPRVQRTKSVL